jgi:predicted P-loop ATPase
MGDSVKVGPAGIEPDWLPYGVVRPDWRGLLINNKDGHPRPLLANAIHALRHSPDWKGVLGFNEFALSSACCKQPPWAPSTADTKWTDHEDRLTTDWLQRERIHVGVEVAGQAVQTVARDNPFHPVRYYLQSLEWDKTERLDQWLSLYLGAENSSYVQAVGSRWMISAVARVFKPGVKADCCLILEGEQGTKKSTALKTIAGQWFTDEIADLGSKDATLQTQGVWVIEIAELDSMSRGEVSKIKSFMSRSIDRFRPPYGKRLVESPRQCVFAGSVNHSADLRDETGGRRFWPVACGTILIEELGGVRDQLWAEAVFRYRNNAAWWLDSKELTLQAAEQQAERYEGDPWDELISQWIEGRDSVSIGQLLGLCLQKEKSQWTQADKNRVGRSLRSMGWRSYRERASTGLEWRYRKPE